MKDDGGLHETNRAIQLEQGLIQSANGLLGSDHSSMVVGIKSALTQEKESEQQPSSQESLIMLAKEVVLLDEETEHQNDKSEVSFTVRAEHSANMM